jgi:hypothetical protein
MSCDGPSSNGEHRVLKFGRGPVGARQPPSRSSPTDDLAKYERGSEPDDYRHRMLVNAAAFLFVLGLIGAGLWLADTLAELRRNQDCVLAGHRNCAPVEVDQDRRR